LATATLAATNWESGFMDRVPFDVLAWQLQAMLSERLPQLAADWWQTLVLDKLTFQQQAFAKQHRHQKLDELDLASLLRVFDQNWYDLSQQADLPAHVRNWL